MIDQMSVVSSQSSVATDYGLRTTDKELRKVAKEMESLFAYQLIKVMRETTNNMFSKKDFGYNTYMSLFDMEISRLFAERGLGLQDALIRWLERIPNTADIDSNSDYRLRLTQKLQLTTDIDYR